MASVKFVHVLKRLTVIDREVRELRNIERSLQHNRSYTIAMKMAVEKQINNLLGERTRLMELKIENPPENLVPGYHEEKGFAHINEAPRVTLEDMEPEYLRRLLHNERAMQLTDIGPFDSEARDSASSTIEAMLEQIEYSNQYLSTGRGRADDRVVTRIARKPSAAEPEPEVDFKESEPAAEPAAEEPVRAKRPRENDSNALPLSEAARSRAEMLRDMPSVDY